jgi:hypothetical protein
MVSIEYMTCLALVLCPFGDIKQCASGTEHRGKYTYLVLTHQQEIWGQIRKQAHQKERVPPMEQACWMMTSS